MLGDVFFVILHDIEKLIVDEDIFKEQLENFIRNTPHEYFTTHTKLCFFKIHRIYRRVLGGYGSKFGGIKINIENSLIIDGNHRYIAYKMAEFDFDMISWCRNHSDCNKNIGDIEIDYIEDWDKNNKDTEKYCSDDFLLDL